MSRRCQRGMTAIEVVVALGIFTVLLLILTSLQIQFVRFDRAADLEFFEHPQKLSVLERVRTDVQDSIAYPSIYQEWTQTPTVLILRMSPNEVVVWQFSGGEAERQRWTDNQLNRTWYARGVPQFVVASAEGVSQRTGVRLRAFENDEQLIFDQIIFPRAD